VKHISVVVPVFNEQGSIQELYTRVENTFTQSIFHYSWELLFVNDGSSDQSKQILTRLSNTDKRVGVISFTRNFGQHPAIMAGLRHASGDYVVLIDGDLQNPPEEIPKLLAAAEQGYDIAYAIRQKRKDNLIRRFGSWFFHKLLHILLGLKLPDSNSLFRVISRKVVNELVTIKENSRHLVVLMMWMGFKSIGVVVRHDVRKAGESKYSLYQVAKLTFDMVMGFSPVLLRFIVFLGFIISSGAFCTGSYFIYCKLLYKTVVPGFTALAVFITFFFGVTFIMLGIIGEHIAKIFQGILDRPYYVIDSCELAQTRVHAIPKAYHYSTDKRDKQVQL